ncbi:MAG TPA: histidine kinase [Candidatus Tetragenococcus pullicola]|nr:histidine kinase [Candidatus Tetragenococcus pullicola]
MKKSTSLSNVLNSFYLFFLVIVIVLSFVFANVMTRKQVVQTTYQTVENNLEDKYKVFDRSFQQLFEQVVSLSKDPNLVDVINDQENSLRAAVNMNKTIKDLYYRYQDTLDAIYINVNDGAFYFNGGTIDSDIKQLDFTYFEKMTDTDENGYFWLTAQKNPFSLEDEPTIALGKMIGNKHSEAKGVILFSLKPEWLADLLNESFVTKNGQLILVSDGKDVLKNTPATQKKVITTDSKKVKVNGQTYVKVQRRFSINQWDLLAVFPKKDMELNNQRKLPLMLTMIGFLLLVGTAMVIIINKFLSHPIQKLANEIENTTIHEKSELLNQPKSSISEIEVLYNSFNQLINNSSKLMRENGKTAEERNRLEIELLQSQIDPHFLYNTLYSIKALSDMQMNEEASMMTQALADFYRQGLGQGKVLVNLKDELDHLKNYLVIMDYRHHGKFTYLIREELPEETIKIPKLSLQPIIENAIVHGINQVDYPGMIEITVTADKENVLIRLFNNGKGLDFKEVQQINHEMNQPTGAEHQLIGIGLRSVNLRIKKYFGPAYGVWLEEVNQGVLVKVVIPRRMKEKGDQNAKIADC